jgi:hypothetical protein
MAHNHELINFSLLTIKQAIENDLELCSQKDWSNICSAFYIFSKSLISHMNDEDTNCYDLAAKEVGCNGLFYQLISDHMNIRKLIDECLVQIDLKDRSQFSIKYLQLDTLVEEHTLREENLMRMSAKKLEASTVKVIALLRDIHSNNSPEHCL